MARYLILVLLLISATAYAESSLRVGTKVLTIGDSATRVQQLMGQPTIRTFISTPSSSLPNNQLMPGEQWQYAQDGKTIVITIVDGRIVKFETLYE
ncbi:DUF2845 domain-containing protein [Dyella monticola]|uniref:DUF2845 domain-containing protein n=1 Tax=Dyella monticola TaxID=1927958 RepID=A0A370X930_9GAMM|nr:DUF2845 domain-containing protein [Dyella monticola]RDS84888.1 DUF2845 domain-containing protein [Dyella monticola]